MSTSYAEIHGLSVCLANTNEQINAALDSRDRRRFKVWCQRRASLLARLESRLLIAATAKVAA